MKYPYTNIAITIASQVSGSSLAFLTSYFRLGQVFSPDDQRWAFSANVQSTTCCGLTVIFSFALNVPTEIHSSTTALGTVRSGLNCSRYRA